MMTTDWKRSKTGFIAIEASLQQNWKSGSGREGERSSYGSMMMQKPCLYVASSVAKSPTSSSGLKSETSVTCRESAHSTSAEVRRPPQGARGVRRLQRAQQRAQPLGDELERLWLDVLLARSSRAVRRGAGGGVAGSARREISSSCSSCERKCLGSV